MLVYASVILKFVITVLQVRDYREDWNLSVTQPVAGNYYPVSLLNNNLHGIKNKYNQT